MFTRGEEAVCFDGWDARKSDEVAGKF